MKLTVGDLKRKIKDLKDDAEVLIERVEDVYFDKHGWEIERIVFQQDENLIPTEYSDVFNASQAQIYKNKIIIYAHT